MEEGARKKKTGRSWTWLVTLWKGLTSTVRWCIRRIITLGIIGGILYFGGTWLYEWNKTRLSNNEAEEKWVDKNSVVSVGNLLLLGEGETGTSFNEIIKLQGENPSQYSVMMTIRSHKDFATFRTNGRIGLDRVVLCDSLVETPFVKLRSRVYAMDVYEKNDPQSNLTIYLQGYFGYRQLGLQNKNDADGDRLYVYISKELCQHYIMLKKRED